MKGDVVKAFAEDLAALIGAEPARRLMTALAGRTIYVPQEARGQHPIAVVIGEEKAAMVCDYFHGQRVDFPVSPAKRRRILDLRAGKQSIGDIATDVGVTERFVYKVLAEARHADDRQQRLFG